MGSCKSGGKSTMKLGQRIEEGIRNGNVNKADYNFYVNNMASVWSMSAMQRELELGEQNIERLNQNLNRFTKSYSLATKSTVNQLKRDIKRQTRWNDMVKDAMSRKKN